MIKTTVLYLGLLICTFLVANLLLGGTADTLTAIVAVAAGVAGEKLIQKYS